MIDGEEKKAAAKGVGQAIMDELFSRKIAPISLTELQQLWKAVEKLDISDRVIELSTICTSLLRTSYRTYNSENYYKAPTILGSNTDFDYIDPTKLTYGKQALLAQTPKVSGDFVDYLEDIVRPMGMRSLSSLVRMIRAYGYLDFALTKSSLELRTASRKDVTEHINTYGIKYIHILLPYVADHRINLGVGDKISNRWLSFWDFVRYYLEPRVIDDQVQVWEQWLSVKDKVINKLRSKRNIISRDDMIEKIIQEFNHEIKDATILAQGNPVLESIMKMAITKLTITA
jgi:hypothetical protein